MPTNPNQASRTVDVGNNTEVGVGDRFRVINENTALLGVVDEGQVFEVKQIGNGPNGPEAFVEYENGHRSQYSPTSLFEALGNAEYPESPDEPCIIQIN